MKVKTISAIILYLVVIFILRGSFTYDRGLPGVYRWLLAPALLIAKDFFLFGQQGIITPVTVYGIDRERIQENTKQGKLPNWYQVTLLVRKWLFPCFLVVYLLYLLIDQTKVRNLHVSTMFLVMNKGFLLTMTIVTGIVMLFGEKYDKEYEKVTRSKNAGIVYFLVVCALSVIGGYIVLQQVLSLGVVGIIIANIAVLLLFFVGLLVVEEE